MNKALYYLSILVVFCSCHSLAVEEEINENYSLIAIDDSEGTFLSYHSTSDKNDVNGIIEATVFAVGFNDKFIIVKQHPRKFPNPPNRKITNYYILPLKKGMDWKSKNGLIGPLTVSQFNEKRKELKIPNDVTFTTEIEDLIR